MYIHTHTRIHVEYDWFTLCVCHCCCACIVDTHTHIHTHTVCTCDMTHSQSASATACDTWVIHTVYVILHTVYITCTVYVIREWYIQCMSYCVKFISRVQCMWYLSDAYTHWVTREWYSDTWVMSERYSRLQIGWQKIFEIFPKNLQFSTRRTRILMRFIISTMLSPGTHCKSHGQNSGSLKKL